jgi:hypothetical protein
MKECFICLKEINKPDKRNIIERLYKPESIDLCDTCSENFDVNENKAILKHSGKVFATENSIPLFLKIYTAEVAVIALFVSLIKFGLVL